MLKLRRSGTALMRALCLPLLLLNCPTVFAADTGVSNLLRSLTGAIGGRQEPVKPTTSTMGVRGMDDGEQVAAGPASDDYRLMEGWMASSAEATSTARKRELMARPVNLRNAVAANEARKP